MSVKIIVDPGGKEKGNQFRVEGEGKQEDWTVIHAFGANVALSINEPEKAIRGLIELMGMNEDLARRAVGAAQNGPVMEIEVDDPYKREGVSSYMSFRTFRELTS